MEFLLLGPFEARREGRTLEIRGSKRRALLALLALHANEVARSERLIEELWGERPPANATAALQSHVSRLRKDLGAEVLATKPWGYVLRIEADAIDVHRFEALVAAARPLPAHERRERLGEALALWRGPALADLASEPALAVESARLDELRLSALEQRIDADLELGAHEQLVAELEALVGQHPLRERLRGQLILALYRSGRQAEALETYRETRRVLVEELGIEPSPELRELERAMLRQDPELARTPAPPPAQVPPRERWRWPRSPLALGVAVVALAVAGAALAVLLTRSGSTSPDATPAAAATPVSMPTLAPPKAPTSTGHPRPRPRPATTTAKPKATTTAALAHHVVSTPPQHPAPPHTTAHTTVPPPPPPPPSPPSPAKQRYRYVYWLADDFSDPAFDFAMWHTASHGTGVESVERNGRLEFSIADDATVDPQYGVDQHYGTNCLVAGDFDVTVHFELVTWPAQDGVRMTLGAYFPPPHENWLAVERSGGQSDGTPEGYDSNLAQRAWARTDDTSGTLRLRRHGGMLAGYYRYRKSWVKFGERSAPDPANLVLSFNSAGRPAYGGHAATGAFDDFQGTADRVQCPGVPLPPRKRVR